jgi:hypothetical protein
MSPRLPLKSTHNRVRTRLEGTGQQGELARGRRTADALNHNRNFTSPRQCSARLFAAAQPTLGIRRAGFIRPAQIDGITGSTALTVVAPKPTPTQTVVIGEQPLLVRKLNKKGKPTGKPVLSGFTLDLSVPLNAASASGGTLSGPAVFTISKGGKSIKPS